MELAVAIGALVALSVVLAVVAFRFAAYRARYPYSRDDLDRERRDAIKRSNSTLDGQAVEQLAPFLAEFCDQFDANDARFMGSPIDYVVFDGLRNREVRRVVFLEIKTGRHAGLSKEQRQIRNAINAGRIEFETLHFDRPADRAPRSKDGARSRHRRIRDLQPPP